MAAATCALILVMAGCDHPLVPEAARPALAAYSASSYALDVEFDQPLDLASATDTSRYAVTDLVGGRIVPTRITAIDTLFGMTVRVFFPLGALQDSTSYRLTVTGVRDVWGHPLFAADSATTDVFTGLGYSYPLRSLLERKCTPCHNAAGAGGNYRTDSYEELFGYGSDANSSNPRPNLIPGDARCLLVIRTSPGHSMFNVAHLTYGESQQFINWVVTYQARP